MGIGKEIINKYFDENGITFSKLIMVGVIELDHDYNEDEDFIEVKDCDSKPIISIHTPFNLSEDEVNELTLNYIKDTTGITIPSIDDLPKYKVHNGKPFLIEIQPTATNHYYKFIFPWQEIYEDVFFRGDELEDYKELSQTKIIHGNLSIYDSSLQSLGGITSVIGDLLFTVSRQSQIKGKCRLKTLSPINDVQGNVIIRGKSITSLGSIKFIGGNLSLRYSSVTDLGELKVVAGNVLISNYNKPLTDLSNVLVLGKVKYFNDPEISPHI